MNLLPALAALTATGLGSSPARASAPKDCLVIRLSPDETSSLVFRADSLSDGLALMEDWVRRYPDHRVLVRAGDAVVAAHLP
jgi:hypothetical protein